MDREVREQLLHYLEYAETPGDLQILVNTLKDGQPAEIQAKINAVVDCYTDGAGSKTPTQCLGEVTGGTVPAGAAPGGAAPAGTLTLDEAKQELDKFFVHFAASLEGNGPLDRFLSILTKSNVEKSAEKRQAEVNAKVAALVLRLSSDDDRTALRKYAKERQKIAIKNREQVDVDRHRVKFLTAQSFASIFSIPVIPTFEGSLSPLKPPHTMTGEDLSQSDYRLIRFYLGLAELFNSSPRINPWIGPLLFEKGPGGTESSSDDAQSGMTAGMLNDLPAAVNQDAATNAHIPYRGGKIPWYLQLHIGFADVAQLITTGIRSSRQALRQEVIEELCSHPDAMDANQLRDHPIIVQWKKEHPGELVPSEIIAKAQAAAGDPECDEIVNFRNAPDTMLNAYLYPRIITTTTHGLVSDVIANQGWLAGLITGGIITVGFPFIQYHIRKDNPHFRWSFNQHKDESSREPPGFDEDDQHEAVRDAVIDQGTHHAIGTALAFASLRQDGTYDPHVARSLLSAWGEILRARPRERLINGPSLEDSRSSKLAIMPVVIENGMSSLTALGDGYADAALFIDRRGRSHWGWEWAQRALVIGGRITASALTVSEIGNQSDKFPDQKGKMWTMAGARALSYGLGYALYFLPGSRDRVQLQSRFELGGPGGAVVSGRLFDVGTDRFAWGLKPGISPDGTTPMAFLELFSF